MRPLRHLLTPAAIVLFLLFALLVATPARGNSGGWFASFDLREWDKISDQDIVHIYVAGFRDSYAFAQGEILRSQGADAEKQYEVFLRVVGWSAEEIHTIALSRHPTEKPAAALQKTLDLLIWGIDK